MKLHQGIGSTSHLPVNASSPGAPRVDGVVWSIGMYVGDSPLLLRPPDTIGNPVLTRERVTDVQAALVADPFMLSVQHTWYMFFEVMNWRTAKGEIGLATSEDAVRWTYQQIVLTEPFHLSYPYVFEWQNEYYMLPETYQAESVRLYRATNFPTRWSYIATLLTGYEYVDPSIFRFDERWWMFVGHGTPASHRADILRLYSADDLFGPWREHPNSPIITGNAHIARPAGRVLVIDDKIVRYTQDCAPHYGALVRAFEITELTPTSYYERQGGGTDAIVGASGSGWNAAGMHHIDPHLGADGQWIACVDGWQRPPR